MDPERSRGIVLRQASLSRVFGGPAVPPWPFVFRCSRPPHTTGRMGQMALQIRGVSSLAQGAPCANQERYRIQRRTEEVRGGFNTNAIWREPPNHWRAITRLDVAVHVTASVPHFAAGPTPSGRINHEPRRRACLAFACLVCRPLRCGDLGVVSALIS